MKKVLFLILFFSLLVTAGFTQSDVVVLDEPAHKVFFIDDENLLLLLENGKLNLANKNGTTEVYVSGLKRSSFDLLSQSRKRNVFAFYDGRKAGVFQINGKNIKELFSIKYGEKLQALNVATDEDMFVFGLEAGLVKVVLMSQALGGDFKFNFLTHDKPIHSIDFNKNGRLLITASTDGKVKVWETKMFNCLKELTSSNTKLPVIFSPSDDSFAIATSNNKISIQDLKGDGVLLETPSTIKNFSFTSDGRFLAVLTSDNKLCFYETNKGFLYGSITFDSTKKIVDFQFSTDSKTLAVLFENSVEFIDTKATIEKEKQAIPVTESDKLDETVSDTVEKEPDKSEISNVNEIDTEESKPEIVNKSQNTDQLGEKVKDLEKRVDKLEEGEKSSEDTTDKNKPIAETSEVKTDNAGDSEFRSFKIKPANDAIEIGTSFYTYTKNKYYIGTFNSTLGYFFHKWTAPFYFGLDLGFGVGFPSKKFPYDYYIGEKKIHSPYAVDVLISVPLGLYFTPFDFDLTFKTELSAGVILKRLWNGSTKASVHTKFYAGAKTDLNFIVQYKWISAHIGFHYDNMFKFAFIGGLKFRVPIDYGKTSKKSKKNKVEELKEN